MKAGSKQLLQFICVLAIKSKQQFYFLHADGIRHNQLSHSRTLAVLFSNTKQKNRKTQRGETRIAIEGHSTVIAYIKVVHNILLLFPT